MEYFQFQIGYRSTMRGSQSISDLSMTPDPSQNNLRGSGVSGKGKRIIDAAGQHFFLQKKATDRLRTS